MFTGQQHTIVNFLRRAVQHPGNDSVSDGQLLKAFLDERDEVAFETLVRRHGSMVLGVCRRTLGHAQDAEDAFQATFLVLLHKAQSLLSRKNIGNWLHGVAYHTALKAKAMEAKRRRKEHQAAEISSPLWKDDLVWNDLPTVLDRELRALPENYRTVLIFCDLEGATRKEAAQQFGWPEGTVSGRLSRAREMLAKRLSRRGVELTAAMVATMLTVAKSRAACVPVHLLRSTVRVGILVAGRDSLVVGSSGGNVSELVNGTMKSMLLAKLKIPAAVLGLLLCCLVVVSYTALAIGPVQNQKAKNRSARIDTLIKQLDSKRFRTRETATLKLKNIGDPALNALRHAATHGSLETQIRAKEIIAAIERSWQVRIFKGHTDSVPEISVAPDGRFFVSAGRSEGTIRIWDIQTGKQICDCAPVKEKYTVQIEDNSSTLATRRAAFLAKERARIIHNLNRPRIIEAARWVWGVAYSPDGRYAISTDGALQLWDAKTGKALKRFSRRDQCITTVAYSPDGKFVLSGHDSTPGMQKHCKVPRLWDVKTGKLVRGFVGHTESAWNVAFSPNGKRAVSCSPDHTIRVWNVRSGKQLQCLKGHTAPVTAAVFSPNKNTILSSSWDKTLRLWDVDTGKTLRTFKGHIDKVCDVTMSPDSRRALSCGFDQTVILWDIPSGRLLRRFKGHTACVGSVAFLPNGQMALSASYDKTIRLWRLPG